MHDSIETIQNTIVFVYNLSRFLLSYNLNKMKFYYSDYTSNIFSDYKSFVKINEPVTSNSEEDENQKEQCVENSEPAVVESET
jgi:hypothetical protein